LETAREALIWNGNAADASECWTYRTTANGGRRYCRKHWLPEGLLNREWINEGAV